MATIVTDDMRDAKTPATVRISGDPRAPYDDPTLGVAVRLAPLAAGRTARHRLVAVGDSLTQGFQSGAIYNTDLSYPMLIARELGCDAQFRHPRYEGFGGLPLNIELMIRTLEHKHGDAVPWWELPLALFDVRHLMAQIEDWWERGPGSIVPPEVGIKHNLAVYGWDLRDTLERNADTCLAAIEIPRDDWLDQIVQNAGDRSALRVLATARARASDGASGAGAGKALTPIEAAAALGAEGSALDGTGDGIETLIVMLGANNALRSVVKLSVAWSEAPAYADLDAKSAFTVWDPAHFEAELALVVKQLAGVRARHVIFGTVPHVTIAPIAHGVARKVRPGSRYFEHYTRPWISDEEFDPTEDPHLTSQEARAIDCAIDQYNDAIATAVRKAREAGLDWYVFDLAGMLDRLASRRYAEDPAARPEWWRPYPLPDALRALPTPPDSRFLRSGPAGLESGGLFSLDGVHPTTIGYGLVAQELIRIMERAGVTFYRGDGTTPRAAPVSIDFADLVTRDTLVSSPPRSLSGHLAMLGWAESRFDFLRRIFRA